VKPGTSRWLKRIGVLAGTLFVGCLLAELAVVLVLGEQVKFPRHVVGTDYGLRVNEPGAVYRHKSADVEVWFQINSRGLRADVDHPYEKPEGTKRIVTLGDSFTIGYEVEEEQCFSRVMERELRALGHDVEVLNAGVSGFSTAEECLYLERELLKYEPDVVVVSFYTNDIRDNIRTRLFRMEEDELVPDAEEYVPMGRLANFLNTNAVFSWLSEYSNAFALLKEQTTLRLKKRMVARNVKEVEEREGMQVDALGGRGTGKIGYPKVLTCAILDRIYDTCAERGIALVVQSIPNLVLADDGTPSLDDRFPYACFERPREGLAMVKSKVLLAPHVGQELLYYRRSHRHWTPFSHELSGKELADRIVYEGFLER
jgi:hypothetical protein